MAASVADYISEGDYSKSNPFKTRSVEIGAAAIQSRWALAEWQSADGSIRGQVFFFYECDHWNVGLVSAGSALRVQDIVARQGLGAIPAPAAAKLVAGLTEVNAQHVAYLEPAKAGTSC
jgi:hypothetical protein